jgi:hypothetical protein
MLTLFSWQASSRMDIKHIDSRCRGIKGKLASRPSVILLKHTEHPVHSRKSTSSRTFLNTITLTMAPLQAILAVLVGASLVAAAPALESATGHRLNRRQGCFNPGTGSPLPIRSDWQTELIGDGDVSPLQKSEEPCLQRESTVGTEQRR